MKNRILATCGAVALAGLTVSAQQPPQQTPPPITPPTQQTPPVQPTQRPPDPYPSTPSMRTPTADLSGAVTLTGCLKTWDGRTAAPATGAGSGAGSAASSPAGSSQFVLTNIERSEASRAAGVQGSTFLVKALDPSVAFSQHLNHRVALTGTVSDAAKDMGRATDHNADQPTADKPSPSASESSTGRGPDDMKMPTLNVTSLKMVSPTCGS
jgi:hypothetical protein